jgi:hypothetical protein
LSFFIFHEAPLVDKTSWTDSARALGAEEVRSGAEETRFIDVVLEGLEVEVEVD